MVSSRGAASLPRNFGAQPAAFRVGSVVIASCACGALRCVGLFGYPLDKQVRPVPTGKVKWYDAEKGFGFLSQEDGEDVYVRSSALPAGVEGLKAGQKVEFGVASGRRGPQALSLKLIDPPPTLTRPRREAPAEHKHSPDELHGMVEDMITLLESAVQPELRKGRYPDKKVARRVSEVVKAVARELDA
jgi:cold shock protein